MPSYILTSLQKKVIFKMYSASGSENGCSAWGSSGPGLQHELVRVAFQGAMLHRPGGTDPQWSPHQAAPCTSSEAWWLVKGTCMGTQRLGSTGRALPLAHRPRQGVRQGVTSQHPFFTQACPRSRVLTAAPEPRCAASP